MACESAARDQRHGPVTSLGYTPATRRAPCFTRSCASTSKPFSPPPPAPMLSDCHRSSSKSSAGSRLRGLGPGLRAFSVRGLSCRDARALLRVSDAGFVELWRSADGRGCRGTRRPHPAACTHPPVGALVAARAPLIAWPGTTPSAAPCSRSTPEALPQLRAPARAATGYRRWAQRDGDGDSALWGRRPAQASISTRSCFVTASWPAGAVAAVETERSRDHKIRRLMCGRGA